MHDERQARSDPFFCAASITISPYCVAAFAASPAGAATKHKKSKEAAEAEDIAKQHDNTWRALKDAIPLALPSWSLPIYFSMHKDEKNEKKKM